MIGMAMRRYRRLGCLLLATTAMTGSRAHAETYRLVQAIGNSERESARNLTKSECEERKRDLKIVAQALGTYNEETGYGSVACLPESLL